jgi:peroxiredoxin
LPVSALAAGSIRRRRYLSGCVLCLACAAATAVAHAREPAGFGITPPRERVTAPEFSLPALASRPVALGNYRGTVVLLHFWATFCRPCQDEMPALELLWQRYREDGLIILGVAADRGGIGAVRDFAAQAGLSFPILHDESGAVRNRYEVQALPTSYVIGRDGKISGRAVGARAWNSPQAREYIESLL